jgi:hypothetical protein
MKRNKTRWIPAVLIVVAGFVSAPALTQAQEQERKVPDTYTAVTTHMTPAQVEIKADVIRWSTEAERKAVIAALAEADTAVVTALRELPTVGVVWRSGSAVGSSIKYAQRTTAADGTERITLVTDKRIGATSFNPWAAENPGIAKELDFSVIEMNTGAGNEGTLSLGAAITIDRDAQTIGLDRGAAPALLTSVRKEPKPYWASSN